MIAAFLPTDSAYDSAACGLLTCDDTGVVRRANATFGTLLGRDTEDIIGQPFTTVLAPASALLFELQIRPQLALGRRVDGALVTLLGQAGESIPTLVNALQHDQGALELAFVLVREREEYETKLRAAHMSAEYARAELTRSLAALSESEARVRAQFAAIPLPTFVWTRLRNDHFVLEHSNEAARALLPEGPSRLLDAENVFAEAAEVIEAMRRAVGTREVVELEIEPAARVIGNKRALRLTIGPLPGQQVVIHARDITTERAVQERARHGQKMELLGQLVAGIAHEFNNVLAIIKGHLELIDGDLEQLLPEGHPMFRDMSAVSSASDRAGTIVQQLLVFSGYRTAITKRIDVNALVEDSVQLLRPVMGRRLSWDMSLAQDLPPVFGDPDLLAQVLTNLVINARDAIREVSDGGTITVRTSLVSDERAPLRIAVQDTGVGMTPEVLERVLDPFFTTKPPGTGTGLGLSMAFGVVRDMGGTLHIDSTPGVGTTVTLQLPTAHVSEERAEPLA